MIIREYREDTLKEKFVPEKKGDMLQEVLELFSKYHLKQQSQEQLEKYFRYLLRNVAKEQQLPYNFMVHCDDDSRSLEFVQDLNMAINRITKGTEEAKILAEKNVGIFVTEVSKGKAMYQVLGVYNCHTKIPEKINYMGANFIKTCEDTPHICKVVCASESIMRERFQKQEQFYYRLFRSHIYIEHMTAEEVLDRVLEELKNNHLQMTEEFCEGINNYITTVYPKAELKNEKFVKDLNERILISYFGSDKTDKVIDVDCVPFYKKPKSHKEIMREMDSLIGLQRVKEAFHEIPYMLNDSNRDKEQSLHMAFVGNPGTGKTMVAQMAADMLYCMGVIEQNKVVTVSALDLIGQYIGHTAPITKGYCQKAYGGILFIDEAYLLATSKNQSSTDQVRQECVGTLLQEMENNRDRLMVIFAGYAKEMEEFLYHSNAGLGSRIYKVIQFDDYSDDELVQIFLSLSENEGYTVEEEAINRLRLKLSTMRYAQDFGNARTVRNLYGEVKKECKSTDNDKVIRAKHVKLETSLRDFPTVKKELDGMIGLTRAKQEISRAVATHKFLKESYLEIPFSKHMLFLGNSGTGKSTVANMFCEMLFSVGATKSPNVVSIAAGDLMGRTNSADALKDYCKRAAGGVLFIDEAYALQAYPQLCAACIGVLLEVMEASRDDLTVILAGYEKEMKAFLDNNQGLKSRFPVTVYFDDYSREELQEIFLLLCNKYGFSVSSEGLNKFDRVIHAEKNKKAFGNARTVRNIFEQSIRKHAENFMREPKEELRLVIGENDIFELAEEGERYGF